MALTEGVLRTMYLTKLKLVAALSLAVVGAATSVAALAQQENPYSGVPREGITQAPAARGDAARSEDPFNPMNGEGDYYRLGEMIEEAARQARADQRAGRNAEALAATGRIVQLAGRWQEGLRAASGQSGRAIVPVEGANSPMDESLPAGQERRIRDLERKLDQLTRELQERTGPRLAPTIPGGVPRSTNPFQVPNTSAPDPAPPGAGTGRSPES